VRLARCLVLSVCFFLSGCTGVTPIEDITPIVLGEPSFFPTIAAHTGAPILGGNSVQILLNGEQTFPAMLQAI
jgi:hypothetical protein